MISRTVRFTEGEVVTTGTRKPLCVVPIPATRRGRDELELMLRAEVEPAPALEGSAPTRGRPRRTGKGTERRKAALEQRLRQLVELRKAEDAPAQKSKES